MTSCASCGTPLEPRDGPGRPSVYCSEGCRRLAEFRLRAIVKRLDAAELELRRVSAERSGFGALRGSERRRRVQTLKRWIAEDLAKMRSLLGVKANPPA